MFCCKFLYRKFLYNFNFKQITFENKHGFLFDEFFHTANNFQPTKEAIFKKFFSFFFLRPLKKLLVIKKITSENLK